MHTYLHSICIHIQGRSCVGSDHLCSYLVGFWARITSMDCLTRMVSGVFPRHREWETRVCACSSAPLMPVEGSVEGAVSPETGFALSCAHIAQSLRMPSPSAPAQLEMYAETLRCLKEQQTEQGAVLSIRAAREEEVTAAINKILTGRAGGAATAAAAGALTAVKAGRRGGGLTRETCGSAGDVGIHTRVEDYQGGAREAASAEPSAPGHGSGQAGDPSADDQGHRDD